MTKTVLVHQVMRQNVNSHGMYTSQNAKVCLLNIVLYAVEPNKPVYDINDHIDSGSKNCVIMAEVSLLYFDYFVLYAIYVYYMNII